MYVNGYGTRLYLGWATGGETPPADELDAVDRTATYGPCHLDFNWLVRPPNTDARGHERVERFYLRQDLRTNPSPRFTLSSPHLADTTEIKDRSRLSPKMASGDKRSVFDPDKCVAALSMCHPSLGS